MNKAQKRFNTFIVAFAIWLIAVSVGHSIYTEAYIQALEENIEELVDTITKCKKIK